MSMGDYNRPNYANTLRQPAVGRPAPVGCGTTVAAVPLNNEMPSKYHYDRNGTRNAG